MVSDFVFSGVPLIHFGEGKFSLLPNILKQYGSPVLIITGGTSLKASGKLNYLVEALTKHSLTAHYCAITGEPSPDAIDRAINDYQSCEIKAVVAIGGGSVIDAGKAISAMLTKTDSVENYLEGIGTKEHDGIKVPFIAIPTTSGTGSEATKNAVLSKIGENGYKKSLRHNNFVPDIAIIDPVLTLSCPPAVTASVGLDAFTQLLESYTSTKSSIITDSLAYEAMRLTIKSLPIVYKEPYRIDARKAMSYAALTSGITLANAGLGVIHGFASPIGGFFDVPHGVVCGSLLPASVKVTIEKLRAVKPDSPALTKYALVGQLFTNQSKPDAYYCDLLVEKLEEWIELMNIPALNTYGIKESDFDKIIENTDCKNNPISLEKHELLTILTKRLY